MTTAWRVLTFYSGPSIAASSAPWAPPPILAKAGGPLFQLKRPHTSLGRAVRRFGEPGHPKRRRFSLGLLLLGLGAVIHLAFLPPRGTDFQAQSDVLGPSYLPFHDAPQRGAGASLPLGTHAVGGEPTAPSSSPISGEDWNLVIIAVDTLRADMLGSYGNEEGLTPHLDRLASRGWRLADLSAPAPWTLPSFASLMTGLHPQNHGAGRRHQSSDRVSREDITPLESQHTTLAESLFDAGFRTAGFYSNVFLKPSFGLHQGFEIYQDFEPMSRAEVIVDEAMAWLETMDDERFFLFTHLFDPHAPYRPPPDADRYLDQDALHGRHGSSLTEHALRGPRIPPEQRQWAADLYKAEIAYTDAQIGRLLDVIEARPDRDRTVILMVSDHGEELWERENQRRKLGYHGRAGHGHSHYQELLHVPGILAIPGHPPGEVHVGTEMVDLFPTVLGLLGVHVPRQQQGRDLRPLFGGGTPSEPLRLSASQLYGQARWAARLGTWKLVVKVAGREVVELYDLGKDPAERHNLARSHPDVVHDLRRRAELELAHRGTSASDMPEGDLELDPETVTTLQSLGYL